MLIPSRAWGFVRVGRNARLGVRAPEFGTGGDFDNPLLNDVDAGDEAAGVKFCPIFAAQPSSGTLTVRTDGSLSLVGAADGTYVIPYTLVTYTPGDAAAANEGDTSVTVTVGSAVDTGDVGLVAHADAALPLPALQARAAAAASSAEAALPLAGVQLRAVTAASEATAALALATLDALPVTAATQADTALALPAVSVRALAAAVQADRALPLEPLTPGAVAAAAESTAALPLQGLQRLPVQVAVQADAALPLAGALTGAVGLAVEVGQAMPLAGVQMLPVGLAVEVGTALALPAPGTGGAGAADVWSYVLSNGKTAEQCLVELLAKVDELHRIHGLQIAAPLQTSATSRTAGDIAQSIAESGTGVTVQRL